MNLPKLGKSSRYAFCILLLAAVFLLYEFRLFQWQVLEGDEFEQQALSDRTDVIEIDAARGEILDTDGNILAGNRTTYDIVFNRLKEVYEERNATILAVVDLLTERNEEWRDILPIYLDEEGTFQFKLDSDTEIARLKSSLNMADYATADECMKELQAIYECKGFAAEDARTVCSVRYAMVQDGYSRTTPFVLARDVSAETVGIISQRANEWQGVEPQVSVTRYYGEDGTLAPHVVGHVGAITEEQLEAAEENGTAYEYDTGGNLSGYKRDDTLGQDGLEAAFEEELRGTRGEETIYQDDTGAVKSTAVTTQPQEGHTVYTTLRSDLQRVANLSLKKNIQGNTLAKNCTSGAVVVLDVKDFGVLVSSSYPTFDANSFFEDFTELNEDPNQPMFNRALQGVYTPGSVFKPLVALAALQEQDISASTTYFCDGEFVLGEEGKSPLELKCTDIHQDANVYTALAKSCNEFFCNVGLELGIAKLDEYAKYFGLGEKTGVELTESTGTMSNPQEYFENHGTQWLDGASAQTAIGQADNMFTPVQLATYCATIANGGKRLQTHFLKKVTDYTRQETLEEYEPEVLYDAGLSQDVLNVVKEGMLGAASYGTASTVFGDYPVAVACKTGTAETSEDDSKEPNISFICYAPAEDPEIAIAVMMEYGNKGQYAQNVAKDILDQYFGFYTWDEDGNRYDSDGNMVDDEGEVLKTKEELDEEKAAQEQREQDEFMSSSLGNGEEGGRQGDEPAATAAPTPTPTPGRGDDVPSVPFTGEEDATPAPSSGEEEPTPGPTKKPDSPYYDGGG